jgi:nucleoside-diphosphate-sugar epimerase
MMHISSTAVYGIPDHHPLFETDKLDGVGEYGKAKIEAEKICIEYRKKGKFRCYRVTLNSCLS